MSSHNTPVKLSPEQERAIDRLLSFPKEEQTLGGLAGTGKTTVIKTLIKELPGFAVCAFTGKAANVLKRKGVQASTIHSLIYEPEEVEDEDEEDDEDSTHTGVVFNLRSRYDFPYRGFIVDEASMVGRDLYDDLKSFGLPMIFVGDHGQLPPVEGKDEDEKPRPAFNLMENPDIKLETIHRNAGEIAQFAEFIRQGKYPISWQADRRCSKKAVIFTTRKQLELDRDKLGLQEDQIICGFNNNRVSLNMEARETLGYSEDCPVPGDRIMCLQNMHRIGLFNGMQGIIDGIDDKWLDFERDDGDGDKEIIPVRFDPGAFNLLQQPKWRDRFGRVRFDYAYAVTCHKAQGDEWDTVLVYQECGQKCDFYRWCYTAASRAKKRLIWVYR